MNQKLAAGLCEGTTLQPKTRCCVDRGPVSLLAFELGRGEKIHTGRSLKVEGDHMKCPKCSLVTFDYLSKCPACDTSFELSRRLTRRRTDPKRPILIASASSLGGPDVAVPEASAHLTTLTERDPGSADLPAVPTAALPATQTAKPPPRIPDSVQPAEANPSLREMAETERREDLTVNVADAVAAARTLVRTPEAQPARPVVPAAREPRLALADAALSEPRVIKERMMRASRARRKKRADLVTESTDPVLPDWYEPDPDEPAGDTCSTGNSERRR